MLVREIGFPANFDKKVPNAGWKPNVNGLRPSVAPLKSTWARTNGVPV
jgi:hypothetical protein